MRGSFLCVLALAMSFALTTCVPCDCLEATLIGGVEGTSIKITFESPLFAKDKFTVTWVQQGGGVRVLHGTYENDGDKTIRFDVDGATDFLSVKSVAPSTSKRIVLSPSFS